MKNIDSQELERFAKITGKCFINAPFEQLQQGLLEYFIRYGFQPEIGLEGSCLWNTDRKEFQKTADILRDNGLNCTMHAPFFDLAPGGIDEKIRDVSRNKLRLAFELIPVFRPKSIVCHLGYEDNKHSYKFEEWLRYSIETWRELVDLAAANHTQVMFENTYEHTPEIHLQLFSGLDSSNLRFCLDTGHLAAYAGTPWQIWLDKLLPWLGQLHLHDNNGRRDDHIAIGSGQFEFAELFDCIRENRIKPLVTLEPHSKEDLWLSLNHINEQNMLAGILD